jgi:hypothetical protein
MTQKSLTMFLESCEVHTNIEEGDIASNQIRLRHHSNLGQLVSWRLTDDVNLGTS